jgi:hypothetical protein
MSHIAPPWGLWPIAFDVGSLARGGKQRVADSLRADQAITEEERVDSVLDPMRPGISSPFQEEDVALVDGGLDRPLGVWQFVEEPGEGLPYALLPTLNAARGDEDGVFRIVGDDLLQIPGPQRFSVMLEDLLRRPHLDR